MSYQEKILKLDELEKQINAAKAEAEVSVKALAEEYSAKITAIQADAKEAVNLQHEKFKEIEAGFSVHINEMIDEMKALEMEVFGFCDGQNVGLGALRRIVEVVMCGLVKNEGIITEMSLSDVVEWVKKLPGDSDDSVTVTNEVVS